MKQPPIVQLDVNQIRVDPRNVYRHNDAEQARLRSVIEEHGNLTVIAVDAASMRIEEGPDGRDLETFELVGGEARLEAYKSLAVETIPAIMATFETPEQRAAAAVALNGNYGTFDNDALSTLLQELNASSVDLDTTGLEPLRIENLLSASLDDQDPNALWQGMPEFEQEAQNAAKRIIVSFFSEDAVGEFSRLIGQTVTMGTKGITFPADRADFHSSAYVAASENG